MHLVRDCLDHEIYDRDGERLGRIDGIVIRYEPGRPPRVAAIEMGTVASARRLHRGLGRLVERLSARWGKAEENPYRIPWSWVRQIPENPDDYRADVIAAGTPLRAWENWLREHLVRRLGG